MNVDRYLVEGEQKLGLYQVQIARLTASGWVATVPPLNALVSNARLILLPQTRKPYPPASLPKTYITGVIPVALSARQGVQVLLKTGYEINMYIAWSQGESFLEATRLMLMPALRARYVKSLPQQRIQHMIEAILQR